VRDIKHIYNKERYFINAQQDVSARFWITEFVQCARVHVYF